MCKVELDELICFIVIPFTFMGMMAFASWQGYKKGMNETLILCVENPQQCKTIYDHLKLEKTDVR
jgi:hypothetical protein